MASLRRAVRLLDKLPDAILAAPMSGGALPSKEIPNQAMTILELREWARDITNQLSGSVTRLRPQVDEEQRQKQLVVAQQGQGADIEADLRLLSPHIVAMGYDGLQALARHLILLRQEFPSTEAHLYGKVGGSAGLDIRYVRAMSEALSIAGDRARALGSVQHAIQQWYEGEVKQRGQQWAQEQPQQLVAPASAQVQQAGGAGTNAAKPRKRREQEVSPEQGEAGEAQQQEAEGGAKVKRGRGRPRKRWSDMMV